VVSSSVLTVLKNRSILPRPCGRAMVEWMIRIFSAVVVYAMWPLVKSEP
jgi:hypothetical protein